MMSRNALLSAFAVLLVLNVAFAMQVRSFTHFTGLARQSRLSSVRMSCLKLKCAWVLMALSSHGAQTRGGAPKTPKPTNPLLMVRNLIESNIASM